MLRQKEEEKKIQLNFDEIVPSIQEEKKSNHHRVRHHHPELHSTSRLKSLLRMREALLEFQNGLFECPPVDAGVLGFLVSRAPVLLVPSA